MKELVIFQTHIDYRSDTEHSLTKIPYITIYGNLPDCTPVIVNVSDFYPYFYVETGYAKDINLLKESINNAISNNRCISIEKVLKQNIYGFSSQPSAFLKLSFTNPQSLGKIKSILETGVIVENETFKMKTYENSFPFILRFMSDKHITGMCYLRIKNYNMTADKSNLMVISTSSDFIEMIPTEGDYIKIPPLKILSFDIECCGETSSFPTPGKDPVIQIGNSVQRHGSSAIEKTIFCLKETSPIPNAAVKWYDCEKTMLKEWHEYIHREDPDIIIGYNIKDFDFSYLLERAAKLGLKDFGRLGRSERVSRVVTKQQSSSNFGSFDAKEISIDGRLVFDLLHIIRREYKLRSYSLNSVSVHFLNEQKEDVHYTAIAGLQAGTPDTRRRIATYCLQDTLLPLRLLDKLNIVINYTELSRVTRVPIDFFFTRGQSIKVLSLIYYEANSNGYIIPDMLVSPEMEGYEGGYVMEPAKGFYNEPIAVLDFSSLYPSIIISKNLCYTTLLSQSQYRAMGGIETPTSNYFCFPDVKEGLLPKVLKNLLSKRAEAKKLLKQVDDPFLKRSLDGRQLALKICANSIYGFTGSPTGKLPCIEISQSTTSFGREIIFNTKELIEKNFNKANGKPYNANVIYGDTDSVMISFMGLQIGNKPDENRTNTPCNDRDRLAYVMNAARVIAEFVTKTFEKPISLAFEKIYSPYLLMNKKRYAGLIYTKPDAPDKIDTKGIETVRRDNCEMVKNVIQKCLDLILYENDVDKAISYVKNVVRDVYLDNIDLSQLVISKTYTKANYSSRQAHTELAKRLEKRGESVGIGDRIPYVIVDCGKNMQAYEKSEDPVYVLENNLPIDKEYYIEQQLSKPVKRLFEPIIDNVSSLFIGEHTKVHAQKVSVQGPMNMFVKTVDECIGCRKLGSILCDRCRPNFPEYFQTVQDSYNEKTRVFNECWVQCQRCQGSVVNEVLCVNRICPIWYRRTKIKKELNAMQSKMDKIMKLSW